MRKKLFSSELHSAENFFQVGVIKGRRKGELKLFISLPEGKKQMLFQIIPIPLQPIGGAIATQQLGCSQFSRQWEVVGSVSQEVVN